MAAPQLARFKLSTFALINLQIASSILIWLLILSVLIKQVVIPSNLSLASIRNYQILLNLIYFKLFQFTMKIWVQFLRAMTMKQDRLL